MNWVKYFKKLNPAVMLAFISLLMGAIASLIIAWLNRWVSLDTLRFSQGWGILIITVLLVLMFLLGASLYFLQIKQRELVLVNECFRIATTSISAAVFTYDIAHKTITPISPVKEVLNPVSALNNAEGEQLRRLGECYLKIDEGEAEASCMIKVANNGEEIWYDVVIKNIFDNRNKPVRAVVLVADVTERMEKELSLTDRAEKDFLTGIYNRTAIIHQVNYTIACDKTQKHALLIIDLDHFKQFNDKLGHMAGDELLREFAKLLSSTFRKTDVCGRLGGDEFIVFVKRLDFESLATSKAQEMLKAISELKVNNTGNAEKVTCSIGIAMAPRDGSTFNDLYKKADSALYAAKRAGKNRFTLYT